jgi:glycosyltransferase involved in cell wall biosynthesis
VSGGPERPAILCFAGDAWDGNPHSRHHLMRRFAGRWEVLFVEGLPMRALAMDGPAELRRVAAKLRARAGLRTVAPHLHVLRPPPIPPAGRAGREVLLEVLRRQVLGARRRVGATGPAVSWFSQPIAAPLRGRLGDGGSVLYYQDRYDAFSHVDAELLRRSLTALARGCDVSIASAAALADDLRDLGAEPHLVPHGVELDRFVGAPEPPPDLEGLERPLVGCIGLIDDYFDFAAVRAVADRLERGTVVFVGAANTDVAALRHPRIALLGRRPYDTIPAYVAAFATCLVPFAVNRLTVGVNPIKLREYLAAGRPVVATDLPETVRYGEVIELAGDPDGFAAAVLRTLAPGYDTEAARARRRASVAGESWDAVAGRIDALMLPLVTGRDAAPSPPVAVSSGGMARMLRRPRGPNA